MRFTLAIIPAIGWGEMKIMLLRYVLDARNDHSKDCDSYNCQISHMSQ